MFSSPRGHDDASGSGELFFWVQILAVNCLRARNRDLLAPEVLRHVALFCLALALVTTPDIRPTIIVCVSKDGRDSTSD
jgi:hypothetical protein